MGKKIVNPALGKKLAALREGKGLTQTALAESSGVPLGTIREFEQGKREPLLSNAQRLARALKFDLNKLPLAVEEE